MIGSQISLSLACRGCVVIESNTLEIGSQISLWIHIKHFGNWVFHSPEQFGNCDQQSKFIHLIAVEILIEHHGMYFDIHMYCGSVSLFFS